MVLFLGIFFVASFYFFKNSFTEAQERIKIFPASYSGDWQNPKSAFFHDLGEEASSEKFNKENSAYPSIEIPETASEATVTEPVIPVEIITSETATSDEIIATTTEATTTEEVSTATQEIISFEAATASEENSITPEETTTAAEATTTARINNSSLFTKIWGRLKSFSFALTNKIKDLLSGVAMAEEATTSEATITESAVTEATTTEATTSGEFIPTEATTTETTTEATTTETVAVPDTASQEKHEPAVQEKEMRRSVLILSDFSLPEIEKAKIKLVQLRMSLAGRGKAGDKLIIDYYYQDLWRGLAEINLEKEISNKLNGGYFLYGLPVFEKWEDLANLEIRFTYLKQQETSDKKQEVYLDAVWLEVEKEETEKAKMQPEEKFILRPMKKDWKRDEEPEFEFQEMPQKKRGLLAKVSSIFVKKETRAVLIDPEGNDIPGGTIIQDNKIKIIKSDKRSFRPGRYRLEVKIIEGDEEFTQEQDFTWGVLAINTNKSIYLALPSDSGQANERAYLQMGVLDNQGHTVCDADLVLEITNPSGGKTILETASGDIARNPKCGPNNVIDTPDYFAYYTVGGAGIYQMKLTATTFSGIREITDQFEVRDGLPFDIERTGPTRIYPSADYKIVLKIKAKQEFKGYIVETVPESFEIPSDNVEYSIESVGNGEKKLIWQNIDLKAGDELKLEYAFDAPDVSPYFYLLGPLEFHD